VKMGGWALDHMGIHILRCSGDHSRIHTKLLPSPGSLLPIREFLSNIISQVATAGTQWSLKACQAQCHLDMHRTLHKHPLDMAASMGQEHAMQAFPLPTHWHPASISITVCRPESARGSKDNRRLAFLRQFLRQARHPAFSRQAHALMVVRSPLVVLEYNQAVVARASYRLPRQRYASAGQHRDPMYPTVQAFHPVLYHPAQAFHPAPCRHAQATLVTSVPPGCRHQPQLCAQRDSCLLLRRRRQHKELEAQESHQLMTNVGMARQLQLLLLLLLLPQLVLLDLQLCPLRVGQEDLVVEGDSPHRQREQIRVPPTFSHLRQGLLTMCVFQDRQMMTTGVMRGFPRFSKLSMAGESCRLHRRRQQTKANRPLLTRVCWCRAGQRKGARAMCWSRSKRYRRVSWWKWAWTSSGAGSMHETGRSGTTSVLWSTGATRPSSTNDGQARRCPPLLV